jgi:hypothetical protein
MLITFLFVGTFFLHAQNNPYYEEDGGAGIRIAVMEPAGEGIPSNEEWLLRLVQSTLTSDFDHFSGMTVLDRQNLETIISAQNESYSGHFSEDDYIELGKLTNTQFIAAGSLIKTGGGFILEMSVSNAETGERIASFPPKNCSLNDLQSTSIMKDIAESLLEQLGVKITPVGKVALQASISAVPPAAAEDSVRSEASSTITNDNGERFSFIEYLEKTADEWYALGEIDSAFSYYKSLSYYYPGYYKGWLGIIRCYSGDYATFDFIDSEVYMERASITAQGDAEKAEVARVQSAFNAQWPAILRKRDQQKLEEAQRREDNFYQMAFKIEGNTLVEYRNSSAEEVIIPPEVSIIGFAAFRQNARVKRIVLHNNVTTIEREAFSRCSNLEEIVITPSVTSIGERAFYQCRNLKEIVIPPNVKVLPQNVFYECKSLRSVTINSGVERIDQAFRGCESLASIIIPRTVNALGDYAFAQCINLKNVVLLNENITIGRRTFMDVPLTNKEEMISRFGEQIFR